MLRFLRETIARRSAQNPTKKNLPWIGEHHRTADAGTVTETVHLLAKPGRAEVRITVKLFSPGGGIWLWARTASTSTLADQPGRGRLAGDAEPGEL